MRSSKSSREASVGARSSWSAGTWCSWVTPWLWATSWWSRWGSSARSSVSRRWSWTKAGARSRTRRRRSPQQLESTRPSPGRPTREARRARAAADDSLQTLLHLCGWRPWFLSVSTRRPTQCSGLSPKHHPDAASRHGPTSIGRSRRMDYLVQPAEGQESARCAPSYGFGSRSGRPKGVSAPIEPAGS